MVKLANRIEALKMQDDDSNDVPEDSDKAASEGVTAAGTAPAPTGASRLSKAARSAIFREVVLAKVRETKDEEAKKDAERTLTDLKKSM